MHFAAGLGLEANTDQPGSSTATAYFLDVTTPAAQLTDTSYSNAEATELGTGTPYAQTNVTVAEGSRPTQEVTAVLNAAGITAINAVLAGSTFDFAFGQIFLHSGSTNGSLYLWSNQVGLPVVDQLREKITLNLVTTSPVPLPPALALFGSGLLLVFGLVRRRRTAVSAA